MSLFAQDHGEHIYYLISYTVYGRCMCNDRGVYTRASKLMSSGVFSIVD